MNVPTTWLYTRTIIHITHYCFQPNFRTCLLLNILPFSLRLWWWRWWRRRCRVWSWSCPSVTDQHSETNQSAPSWLSLTLSYFFLFLLHLLQNWTPFLLVLLLRPLCRHRLLYILLPIARHLYSECEHCPPESLSVRCIPSSPASACPELCRTFSSPCRPPSSSSQFYVFRFLEISAVVLLWRILLWHHYGSCSFQSLKSELADIQIFSPPCTWACWIYSGDLILYSPGWSELRSGLI